MRKVTTAQRQQKVNTAYAIGEARERAVLPIVRRVLNLPEANYAVQTSRYQKIDFIFAPAIGDELNGVQRRRVNVELKSRTCDSSRFPDTFLNVDKFIHMSKLVHNGEDCYFFVEFTDGLFYYKMKADDVVRLEFQSTYVEDRDHMVHSMKYPIGLFTSVADGVLALI